jgi:mono/diheme cytochrome c family protein
MHMPRDSSKGLAACMRAAIVALSAAALAGCAEEGYPAALWMAQHPIEDASAAGAGSDGGASQGLDASSTQVRSICVRAAAQPLPARLVSMSATATTGTDLVYVSDLFESFKSLCGSCHGPSVDPPGLGGFQIRSANDFSAAMTATVLRHVMSDGPGDSGNPALDPDDPMPPSSSPNGGPYSLRPATDPVRQFAELVAKWLALDSPQSFSPTSAGPPSQDAGPDAGTAPGAYLMSPLVGDTMTNLGYCIPDKGMIGVEQDTSTKLDAMFAGLTKAPPGPGVAAAQLIGLPEHLGDTDLFTLDTATLAQSGVVAFQPTYPLWSDDAGKLRYVRVPRGQSIRFDTVTQEFTIPPNTRFYKTFLKKIIDTDGSYRFRKIETRLIVSRPDQQNADGTSTVTALFGSYKWNSNETDAALIETPLRDGLPFADTLLQYTTDEQLAADILASQPLLPLEALLEGGAARHYAVPSSDRCVQCHMGSSSASFVLGFRPVQIKRRPLGQGGTMPEPGQEAPGADELTQLQRLIDYGVITGISSQDDVLPLEGSEGARSPRNDQELQAQAYMVGNCAHCHNPRGFPSVNNPVLVDILNFLPGPNGGVFQFPLERYSPRIGRGPGGGEPIPYITPSLMDQPSADWNDPSAGGGFGDHGNTSIATISGADVNHILYAPWRSLIYRNVDTPFAYEDNLALFPHMPMNTPGFDCRAKQVMSDWMVSIPAVRKDPEIPEYAFAVAPDQIVGGSTVDVNAQPYVEVPPGAPGYDGAYRAAQQRLAILHGGSNPDVPADFTYSAYSTCPNTSDIEDPAVELDPVCHPVPTPNLNGAVPLFTPARAHWVNTDLTQAPQAPGTFAVRRPDWPNVVAQQSFQPPAAACNGSLADATSAQNEVKKTVALLQSVSMDDAFRSYATTDIPFGLWEKKPGCDFASVPAAGSFTGDQRPLWMAQVADLASTDPVYTASPGAAVFGMICINCHGPNADAHGRLSDNLATMTGGNAIVADFKNGLFGPVDSPGLHRAEAFATSLLPAGLGTNWTGATVDTRAARYLSWMALGGTEVQIPLSILGIVADTRVLGTKRVLPQNAISANMLSAAKVICAGFLANTFVGTPIDFNWDIGWFELGKEGQLKNFPLVIPTNGDAELWARLCSMNNPPPVRALNVFQGDPPWGTSGSVPAADGYLFDPGAYGQSPVGDQSGPGGALTSTNFFPWCVSLDQVSAKNQAAAQAFVLANQLPVCPMSIGAQCSTTAPDGQTAPCWSADRMDQWAARGAINAGLAVYTYIDGLVTGFSQGKSPKPTYDQCGQLP